MRAVELGADNDLVRFDVERPAEGGRALGEQCRDAAVQDAVDLEDLGADLERQHHLVRRRLDEPYAEQTVHVIALRDPVEEVVAHRVIVGGGGILVVMTRRVDLRSDTVTQPTQAMRDAMAEAVVGDDGYGEDPTINALEARYAQIVAKEAALFVPSGVMANQIAIRVLTRPGDLVIAGRSQHLVSFEMGAASRNSSVQFATVEDRLGTLAIADVLELIEAEQDHQPHVAMVAVENTHMPSGGTVWDVADLEALKGAIGARSIHLDGARLFNAVVASGVAASTIAASATTVMTCLTKGLCAPVGSLLAGPSHLMDAARVERKRLGGSMRQAGVLAAAGLVALDTMIERLAEDHERARVLAQQFAQAFPESNYDPTSCRTNIVSFNHPQARQIVHELARLGVEGGTVAPQRVRFVTHAGVSDDDVNFVGEVLRTFKPSPA